jgi:hypothetical protein
VNKTRQNKRLEREEFRFGLEALVAKQQNIENNPMQSSR